MDKEYLIDYQSKEMSYIRDFHDKVLNKKFKEDERFPDSKRFYKLQEPVATFAPFESLWPQIPFFGSTIISLQPVDKNEFSYVYGFETSKIDDIVDYTKDTGKIQFIVGSPLTTFENLDHYDTIFKELNPPAIDPFPLECLASKEEIKQYMFEFYTLAEISFKPYLYKQYVDEFISFNVLNNILEDYAWDYVVLKSLDYIEVIDEIETCLIGNPDKSELLFQLYTTYKLDMTMSPLKAIECFGKYEINKLKSRIDQYNLHNIELPNFVVPVDVGKYLMEKIAPYPNSFESSKFMIENYEQEDLHSILHSLESALKLKEIDRFETSYDDLSTLLDNIWAETEKMSYSKLLMKGGMNVTINYIGELMSLIMPKNMGFFTKLGLYVAGNILDSKANISHNINKLLYNDRLNIIFDFKTKYKIKNK